MNKTLIAAALFFIINSAMAQQTTLKRCAEIGDSLERLVCYDNLAKRQKNESGKGKAKAKGKEKQTLQQEVHSSSEQRFGIEHKSKETESLERIEVEVVAKEEGPRGKWRIELANGQVWKQTGSTTYFPWSDQDTYYIERGALNSFFFGRDGSNRRMRVQRIK